MNGVPSLFSSSLLSDSSKALASMMTCYLGLSLTLVYVMYFTNTTSGAPFPHNEESVESVFEDDASSNEKVTECEFLKKYQGRQAVGEHKAEVQRHIYERKLREEEAKLRYALRLKKEQEEEERERKESLWYKVMSKIPVLKRFVREVREQKLERYRREAESKKQAHEPFKESIKNVYEQGKKSLKEGFKNTVSSMGTKFWNVIIPQGVQDNWPHIKAKAGEYWSKVLTKVPALYIFMPGTPPPYWPDSAPESHVSISV